MNYIKPADRDQYQLLSSLEDLIAEDNAVRIIDTIVDSIIIKNQEMFERQRETEAGRPAYADRIILKLILYGYFNGIKSSRKLEVESYRNQEVMWLIGNLKPDHWTISNYRKENGDKIKFITKAFRKFLKDSGYIKLKRVAIDGSKIKANTNREMLTLEKIEKKLESVETQIEQYLRTIAEEDTKEDIIDELGSVEDQSVNSKYLDKIIELQKEVEQLQLQKKILEEENRKTISTADPEAPLMKSRDGYIPAYNVQIAVDAENKMIADSEVTTHAKVIVISYPKCWNP